MKTRMAYFLIASLFLWFPQVSYSEESPLLDVAVKQVHEVDTKIEAFTNDVGRYPTNDEGFSVLLENPSNIAGWKGPYLTEQELVDPWGTKLRYITPHTMAKKGYGVYSVGINVYDNVGYVDDVTSWSDPERKYYIENKEAIPIKSMAAFGVFIALVWGDYVRRRKNKKDDKEKKENA